MLKMIFAGVWAVGLMTGSTYFFANFMNASTSESEQVVDSSKLTDISINTMSIAMIRNNNIVGYLMLSPVIVVDKSMVDDLSVPIQYYARDVIINTVHKNENIDIYRLDKFDYEELQSKVVANINASIGKKMVQKVLIQSIDFITKEDVRDLQLRRNQ